MGTQKSRSPRHRRHLVLLPLVNEADEPVVMHASQDVKDAFVVDKLLNALIVEQVKFGAHELGERRNLLYAPVVVIIGVTSHLRAVGALAACEVAGVEEQREVGMVH